MATAIARTARPILAIVTTVVITMHRSSIAVRRTLVNSAERVEQYLVANVQPADVDKEQLRVSRQVLPLRHVSQVILPRLASQVTRILIVNPLELRLAVVRKQLLRRVLAQAMKLPQLPLVERAEATVQPQLADKCVGHY